MNRFRSLSALVALALVALVAPAAFAAAPTTTPNPITLEAPTTPTTPTLPALSNPSDGCAESLAVPTTPAWLPLATGCSNAFCNRCVANDGICVFDTGLNRCVCL